MLPSDVYLCDIVQERFLDLRRHITATVVAVRLRSTIVGHDLHGQPHNANQRALDTEIGDVGEALDGSAGGESAREHQEEAASADESEDHVASVEGYRRDCRRAGRGATGYRETTGDDSSDRNKGNSHTDRDPDFKLSVRDSGSDTVSHLIEGVVVLAHGGGDCQGSEGDGVGAFLQGAKLLDDVTDERVSGAVELGGDTRDPGGGISDEAAVGKRFPPVRGP